MNIKLLFKKIGRLILILPVLLLINCHPNENRNALGLESDSKKAPTYREMMNKSLKVDFGNSNYEVMFKSDSSFYWKSLRSNNYGDEKTKTIILDDYRVLTHWVETDSNIVSMLTDFEKMKVNGFETFKNHESIYLIGELTINK